MSQNMYSQPEPFCLCCQIAASQQQPPGGIIYRDAVVILHHNMHVEIPGYLVAFPIHHNEQWDDLSEAAAVQLMRVIKSAAGILESLEAVERVYVCTFAEQTHHLHVHIFPRYSWLLQLEDIYTDGKLDGGKLLTQAWQRYQRKDKLVESSQLITIVDLIRENLVGKVR